MWVFRSLNHWLLFVMITTGPSASSLPSSSSSSLSFTFYSFSISSTEDLIFSGNASLSKTSVELTTNPNNLSHALITGRVTSSKLLHLWDKATGRLADFDTNFTFVLNSPDLQYGCCGLAFFLAPEVFPLTRTAFGSGLGLVGAPYLFLHSNYPFLAVEFDTFQDTLFPDAPFHHVGIDISSMKSVNFTQSVDNFVDGNVTNVWIAYNSTTKNLGVTFSRLRANGSVLWSQQVSHVIDLRNLLPEFVQVGFSASTGKEYSTHNLNSWSFSSRFEAGYDPQDSATSPPLETAIPGSEDDGNKATGKNKHRLLKSFISRFEVGVDHYYSGGYSGGGGGYNGGYTGGGGGYNGGYNGGGDSGGGGGGGDSGCGGGGGGDGGGSSGYTSHETTVKTKQVRVEIGLPVGLACVFIVGGIIVCACFKFKRFKLKQSNTVEKIDEEDPAATSHLTIDFENSVLRPREFSYDVLARATNNFAKEDKLGEGAFGKVYKGFLPDLKLNVAVKKISSNSKQGIKEYTSEVKIISSVRHKNLVQLIGWCHERGQLLLVYEFMENGSVDHHLYPSENQLLSWPLRYKIVEGLGSALLYLHKDGEQAVLHRDIKPSNIMLDSQFNAKVGDFGLAKLVDHEKGAGTIGYIAPECVNTGKASTESDVYSFGVVCLEIACGRKPNDGGTLEKCRIHLVNWVWDLYGKGEIIQALDPKLDSHYDREQVERVMILGLWCAHPDSLLRPSMKEAISVLNCESQLPNLPPKIPVATYPDHHRLYALKTVSKDSDATTAATSSSANVATSVLLPQTLQLQGGR